MSNQTGQLDLAYVIISISFLNQDSWTILYKVKASFAIKDHYLALT